jgi:chorismate mutase
LLCAREISVVGAMPSVVRILMHFHSERPLQDVVHVYLDGAEALRDDIADR